MSLLEIKNKKKNPRFTYDVTFWITSSPPCHHPHHDVILPMTSQFPGVRVSREANIWLTGHVTPCCTLIGPFVPRDLYLAL